jgi:hypothetical protein
MTRRSILCTALFIFVVSVLVYYRILLVEESFLEDIGWQTLKIHDLRSTTRTSEASNIALRKRQDLGYAQENATNISRKQGDDFSERSRASIAPREATNITRSITAQNSKAHNETSISGKDHDSGHAKEIATNPSAPSHGHPHAGARDSSGRWGYVPDVTAVRRWMLARFAQESGFDTSALHYQPIQEVELNQTCAGAPSSGTHEYAGFEALRTKVIVGAPDPINGTDPNRTILLKPVFHSSGKILCAIYTYAGKHDRVTTISETWGWRCDGFFAASTCTMDEPGAVGFGAVDLPHYGGEAYGNMWQKTRSILAFIYDHYFDEYEYFYLAGDDTHLIVENLRNYLHTLEDERVHSRGTALFLGMQFWWSRFSLHYNTGGAGYVLNRQALKELVEKTLPTCRPDNINSVEDVNTALCLREAGVHANDTADAQGSQRFFHYSPDFVAGNLNVTGLDLEFYRIWAEKHGWKAGRDLISSQSISFHRLPPDRMRRHHALLYDTCPIGTELGDLVRAAYLE